MYLGKVFVVGPTPDILLFSEDNVSQLSLAFDQSMQPLVAYQTPVGIKIRFLSIGALTPRIVQIAVAYDAKAVLDLKSSAVQPGVDARVFYLRRDLPGTLFYRSHKDNMAIEREFGAVPAGTTGLARVERMSNNRLGITFTGSFGL